MLVSDTCSRSHLIHSQPKFTENSLILNLPISETRLKQLQIETKSRHILQPLITYTTQEWLEKYLIPTNLHPYYIHRKVITFREGILLKNERIMVPTTFQAEMKFLFHQGHLGIESCKKSARQSLFWPLINSELEEMIKK